VDVYNPKTVQATMGALARVKLHYCNLPSLIASLNDVPVYGTFLDGKDMYKETLSTNGLIVMGNEGNGIGQEVASLINRKLYIPNYPPQRETTESLNVAMATGIICAEFRRRVTSAE
jgi:TrmH family RNA methyltransferase